MKHYCRCFIFWIKLVGILLISSCSGGSKTTGPSANGEQTSIVVENVRQLGNQSESFLDVYVLDHQFNSFFYKKMNAKAGRNEIAIPLPKSGKFYIEVYQFNERHDTIVQSGYFSSDINENITVSLQPGQGALVGGVLNLPNTATRLILKQNNQITDVVNFDSDEKRFTINHLFYGEQEITVQLYENSRLLFEVSKNINFSPNEQFQSEILLGEYGNKEVLFRLGFPLYLVDKKKSELSYLNWVQMPNIYDSKIEPSTVIAPDVINKKYIVISPTYEVKAINKKDKSVIDHIDFGRSYARLVFNIDAKTISSFNFTEDFAGYSWNEKTQKWESVLSTIYNKKNGEVWVFTNHLSTFVLTAIPASTSNVHDFPHCITADFPNGIDGSSSAQFTIIEPYFKYYQDRDYFILPLNQSVENTRTFNELGFNRAMGIATCNGGSSCGTANEHKNYKGDDYIKFEAKKDLDVYLLYDTRGGLSYDDKSNDAPWITSLGFTATDYYLETTDAVGLYGIYKKTYLKNDTVRLHGNTKGATDGKIGTNYWVILKEAGDLSSKDASELCVNSPSTDPPPFIESALAIGGNQKITLSWRNPTYPNFQGVVIRKGTSNPPLSISEGVEPHGLVVDSQTYIDTDITNGINYYYSIFALDANYNYGNAFVVEATAGIDTDNDGLSDAYEDSASYSNNAITDKNNGDTDGDGWDDLKEVLAGFDPTTPFAQIHQDSVYAGKDTVTCLNLMDLKAKPYSIGEGKWEVVQGNAIVSKPFSFKCTVSNLDLGDNIFRWKIKNGPYEKYDDILVRRESNSVNPIFSIGDTSICGDTLSLSGNNTGFPSFWNFTDTSAIIDSNGNFIRLRGITAGTNYLKWNINHTECPILSDSIRITNYNPEYIANAGEDIFVKENSLQLNASLPSNTTGSWRKISGSGTLENHTNPQSMLDGILAGIHQYEWTLDNGLCGITKDTVKITFDNVAPQINSFKLSSNHIMGSIAVSLDIDANDNIGIETWVVKELHRQSNTVNTYKTKLKPILYNLQHADDGNYRLYLSALDAAGNRFDFPNQINLTVNSRIPTNFKKLANNDRYIDDLSISGNYIAWIEKPFFHSYDSSKLYLYNISNDSKILINKNVSLILNLNGDQLTFISYFRFPDNTFNYKLNQYKKDGLVSYDLGSKYPLYITNSDEHLSWVTKDSSNEKGGKAYYFNGSKITRADSLINQRFCDYGGCTWVTAPIVYFPWHKHFIENYRSKVKTHTESWIANHGQIKVAINESKGIIFSGSFRSSGTIYGTLTTTNCRVSEYINDKISTLSFDNYAVKSITYSNSAYIWTMSPKTKPGLYIIDSMRVKVMYKKFGDDNIHTIIDKDTLYRPFGGGIYRNSYGNAILDCDISGNNVVYSYDDVKPTTINVNRKRNVYFFDGKNSHKLSTNSDNRSPKISGNNVIWIKREFEDDGYGGLRIKSENVILATP